MDLYGTENKSIPQKVILHLAEILCLGISFWILFRGGGNWCQEHLKITNAGENVNRRMVILAFNVIVFLRLAYMMIFLLKRRMPWEETISVAFAFVLYYIGFSLFVLPATESLGTFDYIAVFLFIAGCLLNSGGEILRQQWKKKPENSGKIYTGGFFKYSRHINYFGDLLWVTAYAMITKNLYAFIIPLFLFCFFAFYNAPKLDEYLRGKYGEQYDEYARGTKMLIPFIW